MGTAAAMIAQARELLARGVREQPMGSNHAPPITTWYGLGNVAWCDEAISYEAAHSGNLEAIGGRFAYTVAHAHWFASHGRWHTGISGIRPGDIVFFDWTATRLIAAIDHVGLVERVLPDGTIHTLEGNTSDVFARRHRDATYVAGYGRPTYTPAEEDDMAVSDDDLKKIGAAVWAAQVQIHPYYAERHQFSHDSYPAAFLAQGGVSEIRTYGKAIQAQLAAQNATITELARTVGLLAANPAAIDLDTLMARINNAISKVVVHLDVDDTP